MSKWLRETLAMQRRDQDCILREFLNGSPTTIHNNFTFLAFKRKHSIKPRTLV